MGKLSSVLFIALFIVVFFWQFFARGLLPIPSDTIIGLYHPFRDLYAKDYPNGIPFKNFLITDPVRQQFPWRELAVSVEKKYELPIWNPYTFSGTPLLANFQSASFYFFNILFFIMPFSIAWSFIIFLGPLLGGIFLFLYLNNLRIDKWACVIGAMTFSLSGFFVAWMEWGNLTHVALWLPLLLLSIDKLFVNFQYFLNSKSHLRVKKYFWPFIFVFSMISAFFAGDLQIFFYLFIFLWAYFFIRWIQYGKTFKTLLAFSIFNILFLIITSIQWIPTLNFILLSARNVDRVSVDSEGFFIPWRNLVQFIAPDFFGNPTTLNYWGIWNYGEFVGYIGIVPLIFAILAIFFRYDKKTLFFGTALFLSLIFALPTFISKIPFLLKVPFVDTAQPTRLLFIIDFSLAVLAALGFDYYLKNKKKILFPLVFILIIYILLWGFIIFGNNFTRMILSENFSISKNNLILPSTIFIISIIIFSFSHIFSKKIYKRRDEILCCLIIIIVSFDLFRFGWKFIPFASQSYLFPQTRAIDFLQKNLGEFRIMSMDSRILPPNFSAIYKLKSIEGYDPLYLLRYGELIAASERKKADINPPFGFNRIITPKNYESKIVDLLGVKFIFSLEELESENFRKVFQEGETRIYENMNVVPRAFFPSKIIHVKDKSEAIRKMFEESFTPTEIAIVENADKKLQNIENFTVGRANIVYDSENKVIIETENSGIGFLVLTDSFYPIWKVKIDPGTSNEFHEKIYLTDYNFRGVIVPAGKHKVEYYNSLF